jgi:tetratricopeptide (TPR) repeat protein
MRKLVSPSVLLAALATSSMASARLPDATPQAIASTADAAPVQPYTKLLPPLDSIALPSEQSVLNDFLLAVSRASLEPEASLAATDAALRRLPSPTRLRGFIQLVRAGALNSTNRSLDAIDAIEESVRLLPEYSAPLLAAVSIYSYANRPQQAADYLSRAIAADPETVRTFDDYEVENLLRRLNAASEQRRVREISDRLLDIGWLGTRLGSRSELAVSGIKRRINEGDVAGARQLVTRLVVPDDSRALLMLYAYRPIWPDIEAWAGPTLGKQWPAYLREARDRWSASKSAEATRDYLAALVAAGHDRTAIRDVLPRFDHIDKDADYDLIFVVSPMARTLARVGRAADGDALFKRMQAIWPLGEHANALNIAANHAKFLLGQGRTGEALVKMDAVIADARSWGPEVNNDALAAMHHARACMLHELGRDSEEGVSVAAARSVEQPASIAMLHLCMGDSAAAKRVLLEGLKVESTRDGVIGFVQIPDDAEPAGNYARKMMALTEALRRDPNVLREVGKYGRVLPWAANASAPAEKP